MNWNAGAQIMITALAYIKKGVHQFRAIPFEKLGAGMSARLRH